MSVSITHYYGTKDTQQNIAKVVTVKNVKYYFSYETLVAIKDGDNLYVVQNYWGPTSIYKLVRNDVRV